jgi:hypothetical protein
MISSDPQFTDPALAVIRRYDPETYSEIDTDDGWNVSTGVADPGADASTDIGMRRYGQAFIYPRYERDTVLDTRAIEADAAYARVPVADFTASVLVHEFRHHADGREEEVPAYREGVRFDRKLPPRDREILEYDLRDLHREEESENG